MRRFAVLFAVILAMWSFNVYAYGSGAISTGADLGEKDKSDTLKIVEDKKDVPEVTVNNEEEKKYLSEAIPENRISSKAVVCASVNGLDEGQGIIVHTFNTSYITPEMLANCLITAGIKDIDVKIAAPYRVSGTTSMIYVIKAYEKMTGDIVTEDARTASSEELALMSELGQKFGMQKALQFINGIKLEVVRKPIQSKRSLNEIISLYENKFNIALDESIRSNTVKLMDEITRLGLKEEDVLEQQKNISQYIDDVSKTAVDENIFNKILNWLLTALKNIVQFFQGK